MMNYKINSVLPNNPSRYAGFQAIRIAAGVILSLAIVRSCIHLFAADGGAQSIAGIDLSVEGGDNIVAIFHQWGAIQLILGVLLLILLLRYAGLTPLILLTLALDPVMRFVAGQMKHLTTVGTPPGEALNGVAFCVLLLLFLVSLVVK